MTTIIALTAAYIFYVTLTWWAFVTVIIMGLIQASTKNSMNFQMRAGRAKGLPVEWAAETISNRLTLVNMFSSFAIWGVGLYAAAIKIL